MMLLYLTLYIFVYMHSLYSNSSLLITMFISFREFKAIHPWFFSRKKGFRYYSNFYCLKKSKLSILDFSAKKGMSSFRLIFVKTVWSCCYSKEFLSQIYMVVNFYNKRCILIQVRKMDLEEDSVSKRSTGQFF